ncbi:MAG: DMT family transporter [Ktedonobacteraceae bacterium]
MSTTTSSSPSPSLLPRHTFSWFLLILANTLWATTYVAGKFVLHDISVNMLNALRMCLASLILIPFLLYRRKEIHLTWRDIPQLLLLALTGFVINKMLEYGGLALTTASDVALLISSETLFTAAFSWLLLHERFQWHRVAMMLFGVVGVYLIVERSLLPNIPVGGGVWRIFGDMLVVLALIFEAFYTVRGKALLVKHSPLLVISAAIVGSTLFWLPLAGWEIVSFGWHPLSPLGWISLCWLALIATVFGYLAWFQGLAKVDGSAAAVTLFIQPLIGTALAIVLLHEQLTPITLLGGFLIVTSVFLLSRQ